MRIQYWIINITEYNINFYQDIFSHDVHFLLGQIQWQWLLDKLRISGFVPFWFLSDL